jgi:ribonucleoside-diphosphate reductase alpha chain
MFDKITDRIKKLCYGLNDLVDAVKVAMQLKDFMMGFLRQIR